MRCINDVYLDGDQDECLISMAPLILIVSLFKNLLILTSWITEDDDIFALIDNTYGVPTGQNAIKFKNDELMLNVFKQFITSHSFFVK